MLGRHACGSSHNPKKPGPETGHPLLWQHRVEAKRVHEKTLRTAGKGMEAEEYSNEMADGTLVCGADFSRSAGKTGPALMNSVAPHYFQPGFHARTLVRDLLLAEFRFHAGLIPFPGFP